MNVSATQMVFLYGEAIPEILNFQLSIFNSTKDWRDIVGQELERKYRATPEDLCAIRAAFPGDYTEIHMETTYYDTPDGALSARRWTLRCRRENDTYVCTLKTPTADPGVRGEWEMECDDILAAIPNLAKEADLPELVRLTADGVVPTCGARFIRLAVPVTMRSGMAELALDQGVLINGPKELPFAEVELELKSGDPEELQELAGTIAGKFRLKTEKKSKFARARSLGQEE